MTRVYKVDVRTNPQVYGFGEITFLHNRAFTEVEFRKQVGDAMAAARKSVKADVSISDAFADSMRSLFGYRRALFSLAISAAV